MRTRFIYKILTYEDKKILPLLISYFRQRHLICTIKSCQHGLTKFIDRYDIYKEDIWYIVHGEHVIEILSFVSCHAAKLEEYREYGWLRDDADDYMDDAKDEHYIDYSPQSSHWSWRATANSAATPPRHTRARAMPRHLIFDEFEETMAVKYITYMRFWYIHAHATKHHPAAQIRFLMSFIWFDGLAMLFRNFNAKSYFWHLSRSLGKHRSKLQSIYRHDATSMTIGDEGSRYWRVSLDVVTYATGK